MRINWAPYPVGGELVRRARHRRDRRDLRPTGVHFVLFHSNGESTHIVLFDVPYQQNVIEGMVQTHGRFVFDDPLI
jgi:hypothetical protein